MGSTGRSVNTDRAEYTRRLESARSLNLPADTMGQIAMYNFKDEGLDKAVDRGWITEQQAGIIRGTGRRRGGRR